MLNRLIFVVACLVGTNVNATTCPVPGNDDPSGQWFTPYGAPPIHIPGDCGHIIDTQNDFCPDPYFPFSRYEHFDYAQPSADINRRYVTRLTLNSADDLVLWGSIRIAELAMVNLITHEPELFYFTLAAHGTDVNGNPRVFLTVHRDNGILLSQLPVAVGTPNDIFIYWTRSVAANVQQEVMVQWGVGDAIGSVAGKVMEFTDGYFNVGIIGAPCGMDQTQILFANPTRIISQEPPHLASGRR